MSYLRKRVYPDESARNTPHTLALQVVRTAIRERARGNFGLEGRIEMNFAWLTR
jgi:hypothetical protein